MRKLLGPIIASFLIVLALAARAGAAEQTALTNPFQDVSPSDPAYQAIVRLHDDGYLKGYPDDYFRGKRPLTRYEMALIIDRVVSEMKFQLSDPAGAVKMNQRAIVDARMLLDSYGSDIKDLKAVLAKHSDLLDRMQFHLFYYVRAPGTYTESVEAFQSDGTPIPPGTLINDGLQNYVAGTNSRGTGLSVLRMIFSGNFDKQTSYYIRLENKNYFGQANVVGLSNASFSQYNANGLLRINQAYVRLNLKNSPLYFIGGRYTLRGDLGLAFDNDYYNGGLVGAQNKYVQGYLAFGQAGGPDLGSTSPFDYVPTGVAQPGNATHTQFQVLGHIGGKIGDRLTLGANWVALHAYPQKVYSTAKQDFVSTTVPYAVGSLAFAYKLSPLATLSAEGLHRFGNDPTTGSGWTDPNALWLLGTLGYTDPTPNKNYFEAGYINNGSNSTLPQETFVNGTPFYTFYYTGQPNDRNMWYASAFHWINANVKIGITALHWGLNKNLPLQPTPSATPLPPVVIGKGAYMRRNDSNAIFINTQVTF